MPMMCTLAPISDTSLSNIRITASLGIGKWLAYRPVRTLDCIRKEAGGRGMLALGATDEAGVLRAGKSTGLQMVTLYIICFVTGVVKTCI
jgi:hypothetical protein